MKKKYLFFFDYSLIIQTEINNAVHVVQAVTPRSHAGRGFKLIDVSTDVDEVTENIGKVNRLLKSAVMDEDVARYLPGMDRLRYQVLIYFTKTIKDPADYTLQTAVFKIKLPANQCVNLNCVHLCFPINTKKGTAQTTNIDGNMITVNNFLAHWIREKE